MDKSTIGTILKEAAGERNYLTVEQMVEIMKKLGNGRSKSKTAVSLGVSVSQWNDTLNGRKRPSKRIADALGVRMAVVFFLEDKKQNE